MRKSKGLLTVLCLILFMVSCAPAVFLAGGAAGVAGFKYYQGSLLVTYKAPFTKTWNTAVRAMKDMNFRVEYEEHDVTTGKIYAKRVDHKPVTIKVNYKSAEETEVSIRVGYLGDKNASMAIKEEIRKALIAE